jgi:hypothetical protein
MLCFPSRSSLLSLALFICAVALLSGCGGLDPTSIPPFTGITGTVNVEGGEAAWPQDSAYEMRAAAFLTKPLKPEDVISAVLQQKASISDSLPRFKGSVPYSIAVTGAPKTFLYVVVALRTGPDFFKDWKMIAVHSVVNDPLQPSPVTVAPEQTVVIPFVVDFSNLPPQPFE